MKRPLVAGNWKMFTDPVSAGQLAEAVRSVTKNCDWADIALFPPFISIPAVIEKLRGSPIGVGGQNLFWENSGAFTGEISGEMLSKAKCEWVIIGHSERRAQFGESDETVNRKIRAALEVGLKPIVCVGETLEQREKGETGEVVKRQILNAFAGASDISQLTIAYEPVWAIGTGKTATPVQAGDVHRTLRKIIAEKWGGKAAAEIRILYGGSVKPDNAAELWREEDVDGFLVGGASLRVDSFAGIISAVK